MTLRLCAGRAIVAAATVLSALMAGCANAPYDKSITIAEQGSFFVGGRKVQAPGNYDPTKSAAGTDEGQAFWVDQMYVQYQIPVNARKYPLILVHGGSGTGRVWETTPDGREGYQTLMLRRGYPVYIVDFPRRGRAGYPSFNGPFGMLAGTPVVPNLTGQAGAQYAWSRWRLGPKYPEVFPVQQFPMKALDQFLQHLVPTVSDNAEVISGALVSLLDKIGPAILVTHSQSGLFGWLAGARSQNVKGIVAYEPGFVFPQGQVPGAIPLFKGNQPSGTAVTAAEFTKLARLPIQVVYGDNIPKQPIPDLVADGRRAQVVTSPMFVDALNKQGGRASVLHLPDAGLFGNSHFMFSDLNNVAVADQLSLFLHAQQLDVR
ncbi:MAG: Alpha/beta hydrolase family protein [Betaproteobacteria bacterium]|nr:Alpha/beta hydrolase family protein [Betaproteobacteria bacterium]